MNNNEKINLLLVDDRPENLLALEAVLDSPEYNLVFANSGEEALKCVLKYTFAVILLDVQMPGLNGFETAELIKKRQNSKHTPIIFITAISKASKHVHEGYGVGAVDYIFKPFDPKALRAKVDASVNMYVYNEQLKHQRKLLKQRTIELELANQKLEETSTLLRKSEATLEKRVEEKTNELIAANKGLQLSEERFRKIVQKSPNLIAIRSLHDSSFIDVNESLLSHTGYTYEEVINNKSNLLNYRFHLSVESECIDLKDSLHNEHIHYTTKDGQERAGLLSTELAEIHGEPCIISIITDITDRVQWDNEMKRLDRLNLVGEMAAGIAHEIRNPMTTVLGFLQITKNQEQYPLPSEYINLMIDELNRANSIITEFLTLAKNKATDREWRDINHIIKTLFPLIQAEAFMSNKAIHLELGDCPDICIDEKEIRQVILNLALNGLEAMKDDGVLTIRTYNNRAEEEVVIEVQDEGSGIDQAIVEKLGTPFFTTKDSGTGLGLAVCYSVASRHNATIDIKTGDEGTTFIVRFKQSCQIQSSEQLSK